MKIKNLMWLFCLVISKLSLADFFDKAGSYYQIDPDYLKAVRKTASQSKRNRFLPIFSKGIHWVWFSIRLVIASSLHTVTGIILALLYGFKGVIIFLGGGICLVTYFHLGKHFIAPNNYTIPILAAVCIIALLGEALISFLNDVMPFHRLLDILDKEAKIKDDETRQVANDG